MIKAAVIGFPIKQSLSPIIHNYWLKQYDIKGIYEKLAPNPSDFASFLKEEGKSYAGFNITLPYKEEILQYLDDISPLAQRIGAVNTVVNRDGRYFGDNSDAFGFWENIKPQVQTKNHALIIGAGGASRAVIVALQDAGFKQITITNRSMDKAERLGKEFSVNVSNMDEIYWDDLDLIVNCTSLGMIGKGDQIQELVLDFDKIPKHTVINDLVYQPLMTGLLKDAKARGCLYQTGIGMLLHQARLGFSYWFHHEPSVTPLLEQEILKHAAT